MDQNSAETFSGEFVCPMDQPEMHETSFCAKRRIFGFGPESYSPPIFIDIPYMIPTKTNIPCMNPKINQQDVV